MDQFDTDDDEDANNIIEISDGLEVENYCGKGGRIRSPHDKKDWRSTFHRSFLTKLLSN